MLLESAADCETNEVADGSVVLAGNRAKTAEVVLAESEGDTCLPSVLVDGVGRCHTATLPSVETPVPVNDC